MKALCLPIVTVALLWYAALNSHAQAQEKTAPPQRTEEKTGKAASSVAPLRSLPDRAARGTLRDAFQNVRGDSGRWSDEPQLLHAPPLSQKPNGVSLDDWLDQLLAKNEVQTTAADESWVFFRTKQLDDNDRVWIERIERHGNEFTIVFHQAIWQGNYFKTFTYYQDFGVNLGKLPPGKYSVRWVIQPFVFKQFDGNGRPQDNWPRDEQPGREQPQVLKRDFQVHPARD